MGTKNVRNGCEKIYTTTNIKDDTIKQIRTSAKATHQGGSPQRHKESGGQ